MKLKEQLIFPALFPISRKQQGDPTFRSTSHSVSLNVSSSLTGTRNDPDGPVTLTEIGDSSPGCGSPCSQAAPIAKPPLLLSSAT